MRPDKKSPIISDIDINKMLLSGIPHQMKECITDPPLTDKQRNAGQSRATAYILADRELRYLTEIKLVYLHAVTLRSNTGNSGDLKPVSIDVYRDTCRSVTEKINMHINEVLSDKHWLF